MFLRFGSIGAFLRIMLFLLSFSIVSVAVHAQSLTGTTGSETEQETTVLPDPLTPEAIRELVSKLSDSEVRDLLLQRLDAVAEESAKKSAEESSAVRVIVESFAGIGKSVVSAIQALPTIPAGLALVYSNFNDGRGLGALMRFIGITALSIFMGYVAKWVVTFLIRPLRMRFELVQPEGLWETVRTLCIRFLLDLVNVAAFALVSLLATNALHATADDAMLAHRFISTIIVFVMLFAAFSRFSVAPERSELRLLPVDDDVAKFFHRHTIIVAFILSLIPFVVQSVSQFGLPIGTLRLGFWLNLFLHVYVLCAIYASRDGVVQAALGKDNLMGGIGKKVAHAWPLLSMLLIICNWILIEILAGAKRFDLLQGQQYITLVLIVFFPLLDTAIRGLVRHLSPPLQGEGEIAERAYLATQRAYLRMGRIVMLGVLLIVIAEMYGVDLSDKNSSNFTERLVAQFIDGMLYFFFGYLVWEGVGVWINRRLAKEHTDAGFDLNSDEPGGGEGGGTGLSRLATVLPVIRLVVLSAIVVMTLLLGLNRLGVDTTPLLAGAGIVGLAIGFGAQTLVRDVVSGIFFLIDDAFRVGEYLVIDNTVGTVEKISIRSLQLRHHKGPVHTIPYGEIPKVTNNSRDWVIMKLKFTFPFETDVNKIKKLFKKVGAEMLEADYADDLIQTFKSQGVYDVDDVGIVIRGKFMAKPGTQWVIRKDIYTRVQKVLDEAGIQFARREVRVQIPGLDGSKDLTDDQAKAVGAAASNAVPDAGESPKKT